VAQLLSLGRLRRHRGAWFGLLGVTAIVLIALLGPSLAPHSVDRADMIQRVHQRLSPPSLEHPFGTDHLGTDIMSLLLHGSRSSCFVALIAATLCTVIATFVGLLTGFIGGTFDRLIMRILDVFLAFPALILAILIVASLGPGSTSILLALVVSGWAGLARIIRSIVLSLKEEEFILAARSIGCSDFQILIRHILPNCIPLIIVLFTMRIGIMILAEASLNFLGLGSPAGIPSWGVMVDAGRSYIGAAPWCSIAPATAIALTVFAFNFLGDGLRDLLDPRLRGRI